jgi:outer membrane protein
MKKIHRTIATLLTAGLMAPIAPVAHAEDLLQIYQSALESDPVLSAQQASFEATTHDQRQIKGLYYPNVSLSADYSRNSQETISSSFGSTGTKDFSNKGYGLSLRQPLYRRDYITQLRQAKATTRQAEAQLNQTHQDVILRVAQAYFNVLAARDNLEFAQAEKNAVSRQLEQAKQRFDVGLIAITDVQEAQAAYDQTVASEISAQNNLSVTRQALRELTGQLPQQPLSGLGEKMELASPDPTDINAWVDTALHNNFSLLAAEANVEVARQAVQLQRAGYQPSLDLVAGYNYNDTGGNFSSETKSTSVGVQLNVPLYQGGSTSAAVRSATSRLSQSKDVLEQQHRAIQRQASEAYLNVLAGISQVKALRQAVASSESALKATQAGYEVGTRTTVDVLNARRELFRTQRDYARSRYDYILASLRLKEAAGTLNMEDVQQVNNWLVAASS